MERKALRGSQPFTGLTGRGKDITHSSQKDNHSSTKNKEGEKINLFKTRFEIFQPSKALEDPLHTDHHKIQKYNKNQLSSLIPFI